MNFPDIFKFSRQSPSFSLFTIVNTNELQQSDAESFDENIRPLFVDTSVTMITYCGKAILNVLLKRVVFVKKFKRILCSKRYSTFWSFL